MGTPVLIKCISMSTILGKVSSGFPAKLTIDDEGNTVDCRVIPNDSLSFFTVKVKGNSLGIQSERGRFHTFSYEVNGRPEEGDTNTVGGELHLMDADEDIIQWCQQDAYERVEAVV